MIHDLYNDLRLEFDELEYQISIRDNCGCSCTCGISHPPCTHCTDHSIHEDVYSHVENLNNHIKFLESLYPNIEHNKETE
jgi:hypothetical protein